jgi:hypothetical protein
MYLGTIHHSRGPTVKLTLLLLAAGAVVAATAHRHPTEDRSDPFDPGVHVRSHFSFTLHAAAAAVFPLFGADRERNWATGWAPSFLYPDPPRDSLGMVFTIAHGQTRSVWVNTAFDPATGRVQYVYVIPDALATLIDIQVTALDSATTGVSVTYERTALSPDANDHVRALGDHDGGQGPEWQAAIADYLSRRPQ